MNGYASPPIQTILEFAKECFCRESQHDSMILNSENLEIECALRKDLNPTEPNNLGEK